LILIPRAPERMELNHEDTKGEAGHPESCCWGGPRKVRKERIPVVFEGYACLARRRDGVKQAER